MPYKASPLARSLGNSTLGYSGRERLTKRIAREGNNCNQLLPSLFFVVSLGLVSLCSKGVRSASAEALG